MYISKLDSNYCPVTVLRRYIQTANIDLSSQLPLFRPLTKKIRVCSQEWQVILYPL